MITAKAPLDKLLLRRSLMKPDYTVTTRERVVIEIFLDALPDAARR